MVKLKIWLIVLKAVSPDFALPAAAGKLLRLPPHSRRLRLKRCGTGGGKPGCVAGEDCLEGFRDEDGLEVTGKLPDGDWISGVCGGVGRGGDV